MKRLITEFTYFINRLIFGILCVPGILWAAYSLLADRFPLFATGSLGEFYTRFYQQLDSPVNIFWVTAPYLIFLLVRPRAHATAVKAETALRTAASKGRADSVRKILDERTRLNATEATGKAPLLLAAANDNVEVVRTLVKNGADVDAADKAAGLRPLHQCAARGCVNVCEFLLSHGADMDARSLDGDTAMHLAARHNHYDTVALLLDFHADHGLKNNAGQTAEELALATGSTRIANLIHQHAGNEWLYPRMAGHR